MNEGNSPDTNGEQFPVPQPSLMPEKQGEDQPPQNWQIEIRWERTQRTLRMQERLLYFLMVILGVSLITTVALLILTGLKDKTGFDLPAEVLIAFITATIAELAGLLGVYFKSWKFPDE